MLPNGSWVICTCCNIDVERSAEYCSMFYGAFAPVLILNKGSLIIIISFTGRISDNPSAQPVSPFSFWRVKSSSSFVGSRVVSCFVSGTETNRVRPDMPHIVQQQ